MKNHEDRKTAVELSSLASVLPIQRLPQDGLKFVKFDLVVILPSGLGLGTGISACIQSTHFFRDHVLKSFVWPGM